MRRGEAALAACVAAVAAALIAGGTAGAAGSLAWRTAPRALLTAPKYGQINLSCVASGFCIAVSPAGRSATWDGSWHAAPSLSSSVGSVAEVSCVDSSFCVAVASSGTSARTNNYASVWNGTSWRAPVKLYTVKTQAGFYTSLHGVSCTSTTFCMTSGGGESFEFNGTTWTGHRGVISGTDGNGVIACASRSFCVNLHDGSPNTWNGSSWRYTRSEPLSDTIPGVAGFFTQVSCGSAAFCVGVGVEEGAVVWNGARWSISGGLAKTASRSVSCASAVFCVATSHTSHATLVWNGSSWGALPGFPLGPEANVSCGRAGSCVAIDNSGATAALSR
jgi:hypothetical protein